MTNYEIITAVLASGTLLTGFGTIWYARVANETNKKIAQRQGVIELHTAWRIVNDIDIDNPIGPDVVNAVNALSLTASLWNHDVLDKNLLYQSYWSSYKLLFDKISRMDNIIPGHKFTGASRLANDIRKAYSELERMDYQTVKTTKL